MTKGGKKLVIVESPVPKNIKFNLYIFRGSSILDHRVAMNKIGTKEKIS